MVLNMGISWSASAKDVRISLIALMPTNTDIMEMEKPIANKIVVGRHFRFNFWNIVNLSFLFSLWLRNLQFVTKKVAHFFVRHFPISDMNYYLLQSKTELSIIFCKSPISMLSIPV